MRRAHGCDFIILGVAQVLLWVQLLFQASSSFCLHCIVGFFWALWGLGYGFCAVGWFFVELFVAVVAFSMGGGFACFGFSCLGVFALGFFFNVCSLLLRL